MPLQQLEDVRARVQAFCAENGIAFLDLLPPLQAAGLPDTLLYFAGDAHWNAAGHRVAAEVIAAEIQGRGWLDE